MSRFLYSFRIPAVVLSAILQVMPMVRQALPAFQTSGSVMAIIFRWGVGAAAALGSVQAVSGASTVITTGDLTATNGVPTSTRLLTSPQSAGWWSANGTPPGVNLTQSGSRWYLDGTPRAVGVYPVALVAKSKASAGSKETTSKTITFTVLEGSGGNNSPPTANAQSVSTAEDSSRSITLSGSDPDGDSLTYQILNQPAHGTLTGASPNVIYTPVANYNGSDSFTFRVNDGTVNSSSATVSITVTEVNDAPVATAQSVNTPEDTPKAITLGGSDVEGSSLTYTIVANPAHGTLSGTAPNITYNPAANYNGPDGFTFRVNDGSLNSSAATVSITVTAVNDAPVATAQSVNTPEDTPTAITLGGSDVEGSSLTYTIVANPAHGSLGGTAPNVTYTPYPGYSGIDSFTFRVNDGSLDSALATVSINVSSVNSAPAANAQSVSTPENTAKAITLDGSDPDGDPLTYAILTNPAHGSLSGSAPNVTYTPSVNYNGPDSFTFSVNDGAVDSLPATVSITVSLVNEVPTANSQTVSTAEDNAKAITLGGSDPDGDPLTYAILANPAHGSLSGSAPNVTYTPTANHNGTDSFTFKVNDGSADSAPATVSLTVTPVNDPPTTVATTNATLLDTSITLLPLLSSTDPDGDALTITSVAPTNGTAVIQGGTSILFAPAQSFEGTAHVGYTLSDSHGGTATGLITIDVTGASGAEFSVQPGAIALSPQTGLFDQQATVSNIGSAPAAVRLKVGGLPAGVILYNAAGEDAGVPYVQYNTLVNPGESVVFNLEFYVPDRQMPANTLSAEAVLPESTNPVSGAGLEIENWFMDRTDPSNPRLTITFPTVPGHGYTIIYTDDMVNWKAAIPGIAAASTHTQWHDDGPPKTDSKPAGGRFYRVIEQ